MAQEYSEYMANYSASEELRQMRAPVEPVKHNTSFWDHQGIDRPPENNGGFGLLLVIIIVVALAILLIRHYA